MCKGIGLTVIGLVLFCFGMALADDDIKCLERLQGIPQRELDKIINGEAPWPEELFPLSIWTDKDQKMKKLTDEFWVMLREVERKWPKFIDEQMQLFKKSYGPDIKNSYDLFLKEQAQLKASDYFETSAPVKARKTLKRLIDLAYFPASYLYELQGVSLDKIRVLSYNQGSLRIILFDILEFTKENRVVLPLGPEANPQDGDNVFSDNDKIFFMVADAGDQIDEGYIKEKFPRLKAVQEVEISYQKDNEKGFVYVATFSDKAPMKSPFDYVDFYPEVGITVTPFVFNQCECRKVKGDIVPTLGIRTWATAPQIGGTPIDIHNRLRLNTTIAFRIGTKREREDDFNLAWRAWYDGSVMNYRRATWKMSTPLGIGAPTVFCDIVATTLSLFSYISWYNPFDPSLLVKHTEISIGEDLNKRVLLDEKAKTLKEASRFITSADKDGVDIDGVMSGKEQSRDNTRPSWFVVTGLPGTICYRTAYDDFLTENAKFSLDWIDSAEDIGYYNNRLVLDNFRNRQEYFYIEWNNVPYFWNSDPNKYGWENLDLILKHRDKPLTYKIGTHSGIKSDMFIHIPDIKVVKEDYKY